MRIAILTSFIDLTPERTLKESVSCESIEVPLDQPIIDPRQERKNSEILQAVHQTHQS
ncbi:MAG: hypothetical protein WBF33_20510 [Candidatus Nitrosopolaris sp.]|jgi:hypothetical protein